MRNEVRGGDELGSMNSKQVKVRIQSCQKVAGELSRRSLIPPGTQGNVKSKMECFDSVGLVVNDASYTRKFAVVFWNVKSRI